MALIFGRLAGQAVCIGEEVRVRVAAIGISRVRLAIEAPRSIPVHREEVFEEICGLRRERAACAAAEPIQPACGAGGPAVG